MYPLLIFFMLSTTQYYTAVQWSATNYSDYTRYLVTEKWIEQPKNVSYGLAGWAHWTLWPDGSKECKITIRPDFNKTEKVGILFHEICHCERFWNKESTKNTTFEEDYCDKWSKGMTRRMRNDWIMRGD